MTGSLPLDVLACALVGALLALERTAFLQAMVARPIVAGPIFGVLLGAPEAGLAVGAPLELLFLGAAAMGQAAPLHDGLVAVAAGTFAAAATAAGAPMGVAASVACLVALPFGWVGRAADRAFVVQLGARATLARAHAEAGDPDAALAVHLGGLLRPSALGALVAALGALAGAGLAVPMQALEHGRFTGIGLVWAVGSGAAISLATGWRRIVFAAVGASAVIALILRGAAP